MEEKLKKIYAYFVQFLDIIFYPVVKAFTLFARIIDEQNEKRGRSWGSRQQIPIILFIVFTSLFALTSWDKLKRHSQHNQYVYLAEAILQGRLSLPKDPPNMNDWAYYHIIKLRDGEVVKGIILSRDRANQLKVKTLQGNIVPVDSSEIQSNRRIFYVSFPPLPAFIMLPLVKIWGLNFNDVLFTVLLAGLNAVILFYLLQYLTRLRLSSRKTVENLVLTLLFSYGTVNFWSAVMGEVWYTAQIVGILLLFLFMFCAIQARYPFLAGLCIGGLYWSRPTTVVAALFLLHQLFFKDGQLIKQGFKEAFYQLIWFALPVVLMVGFMLILNKIRFDNFLEYGHTYLAGGHLPNIKRYGLFDKHFLTFNLSAAFTLLPKFSSQPPYLQVSYHGMSLFMSTPVFFYLLWPKNKPSLHRILWIVVAAIAIPHFFYHNSGWIQAGFRFSLDYIPFLFCLLAMGGRKMTRLFIFLVIWSVSINTFCAITFRRWHIFYYNSFFEP